MSEERENIVSAAVTVKLDGADLVLRYRAYAFIRYAEVCNGDLLFDLRTLGEQLTQLGGQSADGVPRPAPGIWAKVRDIVWAGLVDVQPTITRDQVARMFGLTDWGELLPAIMSAFQKTLPNVPANPIAPAAMLAPAPANGAPLPGGGDCGQPSASNAESPLTNSAG